MRTNRRLLWVAGILLVALVGCSTFFVTRRLIAKHWTKLTNDRVTELRAQADDQIQRLRSNGAD